MLRLITSDGTTYRLNLKNRVSEKNFRDAWYSMQDMPKKQDQRLRVLTKGGSSYTFTEAHIKCCDFIEEEYTGQEITPPSPPSYENAASNEQNATTYESLRQRIEEAIQSFGNIFQDIPEKQKINAMLFFEGLKQEHVPLDLNDENLAQTILKVIEANPEDIPVLVREYAKYWKNNGK